ncbi:hypothetical protein ABIB94_004786 [Bradyrhizobium sp. JR7.2]
MKLNFARGTMTERLIQAGIVTVGTVKAGLIVWLILTL